MDVSGSTPPNPPPSTVKPAETRVELKAAPSSYAPDSTSPPPGRRHSAIATRKPSPLDMDVETRETSFTWMQSTANMMGLSAADEVVYQKGDGDKYKGRKDITKVTVASDVDEIVDNAFLLCSNVTEFEFGDSKITKIGNAALLSTGITKIKLPDTLKEIGQGAFARTKIKEIEVNAEEINKGTFYLCNNLVKVVLKEGVTTVVEKGAFKECPNISTFIWSDSVKEVGSIVFEGCDKLHELAGSKDQEKVIEYLKSFTPLMKLCILDGKLVDIKKILDKKTIKKIINGRNALSHYCEFGSSPQV
ncbi:hypothetical protein TrST_g4021 [Triparma strigata]|uniref:Leucine-rich repeat domain-containing protein n=1 Tax=Triparma strigata TaxID=1606541 RepID=A0A9W7EWB1_9STRA|nr:hypothetical protein TrST_g4021 [Triparma strigata]